MFPFQPNGELVFGAPTTPEPEGYQIHDDLILNHASIESNLISFGNEWQRSEVTNFESSSRRRQTESKNDRKVVHREVEKKRRQEMSSLHASLGSLLPLGQGKRSVGDQIQEAATHIKQTEKNIAKLKIRRDDLKKSLSFSDPRYSSSSNCSVEVNMAADGLEILISSRNARSGLGLSRLLAILVERQLDVVSCVSTRTEERFLHNIKIEAADVRNLDVSELQDRLTDAMNECMYSDLVKLKEGLSEIGLYYVSEMSES